MPGLLLERVRCIGDEVVWGEGVMIDFEKVKNSYIEAIHIGMECGAEYKEAKHGNIAVLFFALSCLRWCLRKCASSSSFYTILVRPLQRNLEATLVARAESCFWEKVI